MRPMPVVLPLKTFATDHSTITVGQNTARTPIAARQTTVPGKAKAPTRGH